MKEINAVYCLSWVESERGWGIRPDGYSFHNSVAEAKAYIERYNSRLPKDHVPDCYSYPTSEPFLTQVNSEFYKEVMEKGTIVRWENDLSKFR